MSRQTFNLDLLLFGFADQTDRAEEKKRVCCCHSAAALFGQWSCRAVILCTNQGKCILPEILCHFTFSSPSFPYPRLLYPFCPCHNFVSLHVISKLAPNEFLISPNSVAVAITFIVFSFTIPHIGSRGMRVCDRGGGVEGKKW